MLNPVTPEDAAVITAINDDENLHRLISFPSVDKKKTFCHYEAPNSDAFRQARGALRHPRRLDYRRRGRRVDQRATRID